MFALIAGLILLTACMPPNLPTAQPGPGPTDDQATAVVKVITAIAATASGAPANPGGAAASPTSPAASATQAPASTTSPTSAPVQGGPTVTPIIVTQPADFWVVFLKQHRLATISGMSANASLLTNTPASDYRPNWSPDGQTLAFIRLMGNNFQAGQLMAMDAGSTLLRPLDSTNLYEYFTWIPNSQRIAAVRGFSGAYEVFLLDKSGSAPVLAAKDAAEYPVPSPDGKYLGLLINTGPSCNNKGCTSPNDVYVYDLAAQKLTRLTSDSKPKMGVFWQPDSSTIAYRLAENTQNQVEMVQVDGKPAGSNVTAPWWVNPWVRSPDGQWMAYFTNSSPGAAIFIVSAAGGDPRPLVAPNQTSTGEAASIDTLRWQPGGKGLVFNLFTEVYSINIDGSGLRKLPISLENVFFDVRPVTTAYTPPPAPTPLASMQICPGAPATRLDIGRQASVSTNPPAPNNVRDAPVKNGRLLGQIQPGEQVEVLAGPMCSDNWVWWEVRSLSSGLSGWTAEGDAKDYWLVP